MAAKTRLEYTTHLSQSEAGPWTVYLVYVDGVWDEFKWTLEQAEARYPRKDYDWVDVTPEEDAA